MTPLDIWLCNGYYQQIRWDHHFDNNNHTHCQWTTSFLLGKCLRVFPTPTSDTFSILQTPTASQFQRHIRVLPILSPFQQSPTLPYAPSTPTPHPIPLHPNTSPNTPSEGCSETSTSSKGNLETSSNSALSDLNSTPMFSGYSQSCSGDGAAPVASDIKGHIVKVICNIKGWGWSGSMGNAGWWPWLWTSIV